MGSTCKCQTFDLKCCQNEIAFASKNIKQHEQRILKNKIALPFQDQNLQVFYIIYPKNEKRLIMFNYSNNWKLQIKMNNMKQKSIIKLDKEVRMMELIVILTQMVFQKDHLSKYILQVTRIQNEKSLVIKEVKKIDLIYQTYYNNIFSKQISQYLENQRQIYQC